MALSKSRHLSFLGRLASAARATGLAGPLAVVRDTGDYLWMARRSLPLEIAFDGFRFGGFYRHRTFLAGLQGSYEAFARQLFTSALRPGATVVDGGAHIGLYSVLASRKLGGKGTVFAFEPDPHNFRALTVNLDLNGCQNVLATPKALSSSEAHASFYQSAGSISSSLYDRAELDRRCVKVIRTETTTVDRALAKTDVDCLIAKLDLEGAEPLALQGMRETVCRARQVVVFAETNPSALRSAGWEPSELIVVLEGLSLAPFFIDEKRQALIPMNAAFALAKGNLLALKCERNGQEGVLEDFLRVCISRI